jgi:hypothetical protein
MVFKDLRVEEPIQAQNIGTEYHECVRCAHEEERRALVYVGESDYLG